VEVDRGGFASEWIGLRLVDFIDLVSLSYGSAVWVYASISGSEGIGAPQGHAFVLGRYRYLGCNGPEHSLQVLALRSFQLAHGTGSLYRKGSINPFVAPLP